MRFSEVALKVFIRRKDDLPIVSVLNDVMSDAGYSEPRFSWHGLFLLNIDRQLKNAGKRTEKKSVPLIIIISITQTWRTGLVQHRLPKNPTVTTRISLVGPMVNREPIRSFCD